MSQTAYSDPAMCSAADPDTYTRPAIAMYWVIALLTFTALGLGLHMTDVPGFMSTKLKLLSYHRWIGITVLTLAVLHVLWCLTYPTPGPVPGMSKWQHAATEVAHMELYLLILAVPLIGHLLSVVVGVRVVYLDLWELSIPSDKSDALKDIFDMAHEQLNWTMAATIVTHILVTLKHHIVDHDGTLHRIVPFLR